jgi:RimJ/RimL family protein N-acetyltransferase
MADPEVGPLTGSVHSNDPTKHPPPWSIEQLVDLYDRWAAADDRIVWVIVDRSSGEAVGEALLMDHDPGNRSVGFRLWISGARDRGLGNEATGSTTGGSMPRVWR